MKNVRSEKRGFRHLTSSVLLIMVAFLLAVTATLAWFSMNIASTVKGILFEVTTQDSLLIAVKQWKYREITATKSITKRISVLWDEETDEYIYTYNDTQRIAAKSNIQNINNEYYVYVSDDGIETSAEKLVSEDGGQYVYIADEVPINGNLYVSRVPSANAYLLSGYILEEPEYEDYTHEITESQLAKICMNDKDAKTISDVLTNATTRNDENDNALSITDLVNVYGNPYRQSSLTNGSRFSTISTETSVATAYKYEFELYFMSDIDYGLILNTRASNVRSEPNDGVSSYNVKAWRDLTIDNYTTDINMKNYYGSEHGSRDIIPEGAKIFAQAKNAMRIGFSDAADSPVAIWDPHASFGWTKNRPENNLGLEYYNYIGRQIGSDDFVEAEGTPAKALLNSSTYLFDYMEKDQNGKYKAKIKITIWLEGFDADCFDAISSEVLKFSLNFAGQPSKRIAQEEF